MDNTEELRCISLCSGYGGLDMGLKRAWPSVRTVAYVEIEAFACANLVAKMEEGKLDAAPVWTNLKTFPAQAFRDRVHIITAGYPCQPFGTVGKRLGTKDPRHLWPYIARIVEAVRPVWCVFENVRGHLTLGYPEVYRSLRNLGYKVEQGIFSAAETTAPHLRDRLYILASHTELSKCYRYVVNGRTDDKREETESFRCKDWELFELVVSKVAPSEWRRSREDTPKPLFVRDVDGSSSTLDRLRLLGNGVVPQCAEKAIRTLGSLFE